MPVTDPQGERDAFIELSGRVRHLEKMLDTLGSPWWKRLWFRVDGYAPWYVVERRRQWRPWHPLSQGRRTTDTQPT